MEAVALRVEELNDELRHILHAKVLRQVARLLADQYKRQ